MVVLGTERLVLRRFTEADAEALLLLESDPEVLRYVGRKPLPDVESYRRHIRSRFLLYDGKPGCHGAWAVLERASGEVIGGCSLRPALDAPHAAAMAYGPGEVELGYGLRRSSWGQGYATELARALVRRAFNGPDADRVVASVCAANTASIRVLEKAGLRREGGLFYLPGEDQPSLKYGLSCGQLALGVW
jgi:RimJ/RimL family protein N-acetyltransferase